MPVTMAGLYMGGRGVHAGLLMSIHVEHACLSYVRDPPGGTPQDRINGREGGQHWGGGGGGLAGGRMAL
jgi:hypothetical protein